MVCSGLTCPIGWYLANKELAAIDQGRRDPTKSDMAQAAKIIGILGTVIVLLTVVVAIAAFVLIAVIGIGTTSGARG